MILLFAVLVDPDSSRNSRSGMSKWRESLENAEEAELQKTLDQG